MRQCCVGWNSQWAGLDAVQTQMYRFSFGATRMDRIRNEHIRGKPHLKWNCQARGLEEESMFMDVVKDLKFCW